LKTQPHAINACVKRSSQRSFKVHKKCIVYFKFFEVSMQIICLQKAFLKFSRSKIGKRTLKLLWCCNDPFVSFYSIFKTPISQNYLSCMHLALFTRDILTHNIAIKRYCDKKIFLSQGCLKAKVSSWQINKSR